MEQDSIPTVFTPDNEPYLGRESVYNFDKIIVSCLEHNEGVAAYTHHHELTDLQEAASQIIPQGINLALSIRELVRQGYLFAALVLLRSLIERAAIISYLDVNPEKIKLWYEGWKSKDRPRLAEMLATMSSEVDIGQAQEICSYFNHAVHGDPKGSSFNLVDLGDRGLGYSVGKVLNHPAFCDDICFQSYCYLIVLMGRMASCFPRVQSDTPRDDH